MSPIALHGVHNSMSRPGAILLLGFICAFIACASRMMPGGDAMLRKLDACNPGSVGLTDLLLCVLAT